MKTDEYIETYTGKKFYFMNPDPDQIDIIDIAHSLGMQCRYTGHADRFYSIAEHSLVVSGMVSPQNKLWGLLHDATEAYLTDVASPIKQHLSNYKEIEWNLMCAVCLKYGIPNEMPKEVHNCDMEALRSEAFVLMKSQGKDWLINEQFTTPIQMIDFEFYDPRDAKLAFLETFYGLTK